MTAFEDAKGRFLSGLERLQAEDYAGAERLFREADRLVPDRVSVLTNLSAVLVRQGKAAEAMELARRAVTLDAANEQGWLNLGLASALACDFDGAVLHLRKAIAVNPACAEAHLNLGITHAVTGRLDEAQACYGRALSLRPDYVEALNSLALLLDMKGESEAAFDAVTRSLRIRASDETKSLCGDVLKRLRAPLPGEAIRRSLVLALRETWVRPAELLTAAMVFLKSDSVIGDCVARAAAAWPERLPAQALFGPAGLRALAASELFAALLTSTIVADLALERFLTLARAALLARSSADGDGDALQVFALIARQCFINEYVYAQTGEEEAAAAALRDRLASGATLAPLQVCAVAAYFPLGPLPEGDWPGPVQALVVQQVAEPAAERELRAAIPRAGLIEDDVTQQVRALYEEHPYPRWVALPRLTKARPLAQYLSRKFPHRAFPPRDAQEGIDVLIAGCGTGQHSIDTALHLQGARMLAIDLSLASLSYAARKTREYGLTSIEYRQADLRALGGMGRTFDVVESVGVLHHLEDPWEGWRTLVSVLRPGGFMRIGLYSELARRHIVRLRELIARGGYGSSAAEIRRCRQDLLDKASPEDVRRLLTSVDFFGTSMCRDLLFHVQEHRMTLAAIEAFLPEQGLSFLGFDVDAAVLRAYRRRFPGDGAAEDLAHWRAYENENPDTFIGMYQFWMQKPA